MYLLHVSVRLITEEDDIDFGGLDDDDMVTDVSPAELKKVRKARQRQHQADMEEDELLKDYIAVLFVCLCQPQLLMFTCMLSSFLMYKEL